MAIVFIGDKVDKELFHTGYEIACMHPINWTYNPVRSYFARPGTQPLSLAPTLPRLSINRLLRGSIDGHSEAESPNSFEVPSF